MYLQVGSACIEEAFCEFELFNSNIEIISIRELIGR